MHITEKPVKVIQDRCWSSVYLREKDSISVQEKNERFIVSSKNHIHVKV